MTMVSNCNIRLALNLVDFSIPLPCGQKGGPPLGLTSQGEPTSSYNFSGSNGMRSSKQNMVHGVIYTLELLKLPIEPIQVCSTDAIFFLSQKKGNLFRNLFEAL